MFFWGCDARHSGGNLLVRFGMRRLDDIRVRSEGSSRYRTSWRDGTVELHSFCAGWYPRSGEGVVFVRHRGRLFSCLGGEPMTPGVYQAERWTPSDSDSMLELSRPMVEWISDYESWVRVHTANDYRESCWRRLISRMGAQAWLAPEQAKRWREAFLTNPSNAPRAREMLRSERKCEPLYTLLENGTQ